MPRKRSATAFETGATHKTKGGSVISKRGNETSDRYGNRIGQAVAAERGAKRSGSTLASKATNTAQRRAAGAVAQVGKRKTLSSTKTKKNK